MAVSPLTPGDPRTLTTGCGPHSVEGALGVRQTARAVPGLRKSVLCEFAKSDYPVHFRQPSRRSHSRIHTAEIAPQNDP